MKHKNADGNLSSLVSDQTRDLVPDEQYENLGSFNDHVGSPRIQIMATGGEETELNFDWNRVGKAVLTGGLSEVGSNEKVRDVGKIILSGGVSLLTESRAGRAVLTGGLSEVIGNEKVEEVKKVLDDAEKRTFDSINKKADFIWEEIKKRTDILSIFTGLWGMRAAFYALVTQNVFGLAQKYNDKKKSDPEIYARLMKQWRGFGGKPEKLEKAIEKGKWRQAKRTDQYGNLTKTQKGILGGLTGGLAPLFGGDTPFKNADADWENTAGAETIGAAALIAAAAGIIQQVVKLMGDKSMAQHEMDLINKESEMTQSYIQAAEAQQEAAIAQSLASGEFTDDDIFIGLTPNQWMLIGVGITGILATAYFIIKSKKK